MVLFSNSHLQLSLMMLRRCSRESLHQAKLTGVVSAFSFTHPMSVTNGIFNLFVDEKAGGTHQADEVPHGYIPPFIRRRARIITSTASR